MNCIFCKIIAGEIPSTKVYEDENTLAFRDLNPQAPVHVLVVPKQHVANILECTPEIAANLLGTVQKVARLEGIDKSGFRVLTNCGKDGCQSVEHLHLHVLGGAQLSEKMG